MVDWEEVDGWLEGYGDDALDERKEKSMKTYGKEAMEHFVFAGNLLVDTGFSKYVEVSTGGVNTALLTPDEVDDLVDQLTEWLLTRLQGEEK